MEIELIIDGKIRENTNKFTLHKKPDFVIKVSKNGIVYKKYDSFLASKLYDNFIKKPIITENI